MKVIDIYSIFESAIERYHVLDDIHQTLVNPFAENQIESMYYEKAWIDTIQWHCEDEVRNPHILAEQVRYFKNKIDQLNQARTNLVEQLDDYFLLQYQGISPSPDARLNTESPAWSIDRLSILALKIYHMDIEVSREDLSDSLRISYQQKRELLYTQKADLIQAIETLLAEIESGKTIFKVYRQVKMYNDADLNPVLRAIK